tara:strand:- start:751 stop:2031 length:1281 start_codon:yes stop_codon:yes gene_type:complete
MNKNFEKNFSQNYIYFFLLLIFFTRAYIALQFGDGNLGVESVNEWGVLFNNLKNTGQLSWFYDGSYKYPSLFMPPLYPYFLYFVNLVPFENLIIKVLVIQSLIATCSSYLVYNIALKTSNAQIAFLSFVIFAFYPLNLYSSSQISSITLVMFIYISFLYLLTISKNYFIMGIIGGIGILARGEFVLMYAMGLVYLFLTKKINFNKVLFSLMVSLLILSPLLKKNYEIFNKLIITQSGGYVLWRGNNQLSTADSILADKAVGEVLNITLPNNHNFKNQEIKNIYEKLEKIKYNKKHDLLRDKIFLDQALKNIKDDPIRYVNLWFKKFFSFAFFNTASIYPGYYNPISIIPEIIISIGAFFGMILCMINRKKIYLLYGYIFCIVFIYSFFLILPRYKLILLPVYSIFFGYFLGEFNKKKIILKIKNFF